MDELQQEILEQLGSQFSLALEGMLGEKWPASLPDTQISGDPTSYLSWGQKLNVHNDPVIQVSAGNEVWKEIGTRALVAVGLDDPEESDVRATYLELLTQALSGLARFLTSKAEQEITLLSGAETVMPASKGGAALQCLRLSSPSGFAADLFVRVEPLVMEVIMARSAEPAPEPVATKVEKRQDQPQQQSAAAGGGGSSTVASGPAPAPAMDMLLDVEMPVGVSFGRTQLLLKEVIKLSTGSIIELNRTINEPVEVIVNNCVIARGEVVVVEGNYGVRILQIVSRSERLRSVD